MTTMEQGAEAITLLHGDCLEVMQGLGDSSIDLILTDPPYNGVKSDAWDNQWKSTDAFLSWMGEVLTQFHRVLKPNGSLYLFASPQMAARVECKVWEQFNVLNRVRWIKDAGWHNKAKKATLRSYLSPYEEIIFAEHYGADNMAKGEAGYEAKCDQARGFVFEPLRLYLAGERDRAGFTTRRVAEFYQQKSGSRTVTGMAGHWFERVQWELPTPENYAWLQDILNIHGRKPAPPYIDFHATERSRFEPNLRADYEYLRADYEYLRADYEDLRADYEDLRRYFSVNTEVQHTDTWNFPTVSPYPGKHPCEKPQSLLRHIIETSSKPGALVLDAFAGSCSTGKACRATGRRFIGIEKDPTYFTRASQGLRDAPATLAL